MKPKLSYLLLALILFTLAGCGIMDGDASTGGPGIVALGAYHSISPGDACTGGGKINFCSTESVEDIVRLESNNTDVLEVLPVSAVSYAAEAASPANYYVLGKSKGMSEVVFEARFDDGSTRKDRQDIRVKKPNRLRIEGNCFPDEMKQPRAYVPVGKFVSFYLKAYADDQVLEGWIPDVLNEMTAPFADRMQFSFTPETTGEIKLTTPLQDKTVGSVYVFDASDVTGIGLDKTDTGVAMTAITDYHLDTWVLVENEKACQSIPVEITTLTPEYCVGPDDETSWWGDEYRIQVKMVKEGNCKLGAAAIAGADPIDKFDIPQFYVQKTPADLNNIGWGERNPCTEEEQTVCINNYRQINICRDGYWREHKQCNAGAVCDWTADNQAACRSMDQ